MTLDPKRMAKLANIDKHLLHGIKQFNLDPSKGLEILEERGFVKIEEESLASFLLNQERLSKKQIGNTVIFLINLHSLVMCMQVLSLVRGKILIRKFYRSSLNYTSSQTFSWFKLSDSFSGAFGCQERLSRLTESCLCSPPTTAVRTLAPSLTVTLCTSSPSPSSCSTPPSTTRM